MDDPVFKSKYQKYKYKVKLWEKSFRQINGRVPSKVSNRESHSVRAAASQSLFLSSTTSARHR